MLPILIVLILSLCYSATIAQGLTWAHFSADGGDFIAAAATGGVPHPSGYPLYLLLARGFQLLPMGDLAFRTNILSALCTILCVLLLYAYLVRQMSANPWAKTAAFLAAAAYGLAPFVWGQALVTEVYALHALLTLLCIYVLSLKESEMSEWLRGLVFGLAASNHLTAVMLFPLLVVGADQKSFVPRPRLVKRGLGVLCGLSLYLSLPVRAYFDPPINWGDASSLNGFFGLVRGQLYRQYLFSVPLADAAQRLRAFAGLLLDQFTWPGVLLGLYGLLSPSVRRVLIPTIWMGTVFLVFALFYGSYDAQVNLMAVWLAFAIWLAYGLQDLLIWLSGRTKQLPAALAALLFVGLMARIPFLLASVDASKDFRAQDFIKYAEQGIPLNAVVFVDGDEQIFSLWYAQFALKQRTDMFIVVTGLLPYAWYVENLRSNYPGLNLPQTAALQNTDIAAANPGRITCTISRAEPIACGYIR